MPDYSTTTANIPEASPRTLVPDKTKTDATDRDAANPTEMAGEHIEAPVNEVIALYLEAFPDALGRVTDAGGLNVTVGAGGFYETDGSLTDWSKDASYALTDNATNYVYVNSSGTIAHSTSAFPAECVPLAVVVTSGGDISSVTDKRRPYYLLLESSIDHGSLSGLGDDDHSIYTKADGTRAFTGTQSFGDQDVTDVLSIAFQTSTELTIADGVVTATQGVHRIDTQDAAASDDLDTINGGSDGKWLLVRAEHADRT
ncbi:MAG TPA: hypothetical protein VMY35_04960, partial [Phycisphaerae bacterium]|nr:hypothetical protein [Phycisphaerae bacterium]